jgi:hypothetical protein
VTEGTVLDFATTSTERIPLVPNKRVHYSFGMVLGVDEFRQEQEHFEWKHAIGNLLLHGSGTVSGLHVYAVPLADDVEIRVTPGYAISQTGKWMWF